MKTNYKILIITISALFIGGCCSCGKWSKYCSKDSDCDKNCTCTKIKIEEITNSITNSQLACISGSLPNGVSLTGGNGNWTATVTDPNVNFDTIADVAKNCGVTESVINDTKSLYDGSSSARSAWAAANANETFTYKFSVSN